MKGKIVGVVVVVVLVLILLTCKWHSETVVFAVAINGRQCTHVLHLCKQQAKHVNGNFSPREARLRRVGRLRLPQQTRFLLLWVCSTVGFGIGIVRDDPLLPLNEFLLINWNARHWVGTYTTPIKAKARYNHITLVHQYIRCIAIICAKSDSSIYMVFNGMWQVGLNSLYNRLHASGWANKASGFPQCCNWLLWFHREASLKLV